MNSQIMNYHFVDHDHHPLTALQYSVNYSLLPTDLQSNIKNWDFPEASHALFATKNDQLIGVFRYSLSNRGQIQHLDAAGTWVAESARNQKIASTLWELVINEIKPKGIYVYTTSAAGHKLITYLKNKYPDIVWEHHTDYPLL